MPATSSLTSSKVPLLDVSISGAILEVDAQKGFERLCSVDQRM
jgi:hypothetical protein